MNSQHETKRNYAKKIAGTLSDLVQETQQQGGSKDTDSKDGTRLPPGKN